MEYDIDAILDSLYKAERNYKKAKHRMRKREAKLVLITDFKELKLTNQTQRDSYIYDQLKDTKETVFKLESHYNHLIRLFQVWKICHGNNED